MITGTNQTDGLSNERPSINGERRLSIPRHLWYSRVHWTVRWWRVIAWTQLTVASLCMVLDGISDSYTPYEIIWNGNTSYQPVQLTFHYNGAGAAYWSNAVVLGIGICGLVLYYGKDLFKRQTEGFLKSCYTKLCILASGFCVVGTCFAARRWQGISKTYLENDAAELEKPYVMSIVTCFLQVLPGAASLFAPILSMLSVTYKHFHPPPVPGVKLCNKKIVPNQGKFRDIHNDHGIQWTLTKPQDTDPLDLTPTTQNPRLMENFQLLYRQHKETANSQWRSQLRRFLRRSRPPSGSRVTVHSSAGSLPVAPSTLEPAHRDESGCVVEETYSEMTSHYTDVSGQPSSGLSMPDSASDVIRELISENMRHPDDELSK